MVLIYNFQGIWYGMMTGTIVQTCVLFFIVYRTNWSKEVNFDKFSIHKKINRLRYIFLTRMGISNHTSNVRQ